MGLTSKKILTLYNQSDFTLNFAWKISDRKEEKERISKLKNLMEEMKNYEQTRCEKLEYMGIVDREDHEKIYEKIFADEANELQYTKEFLYRSKFFDIFPKVSKRQIVLSYTIKERNFRSAKSCPELNLNLLLYSLRKKIFRTNHRRFWTLRESRKE